MFFSFSVGRAYPSTRTITTSPTSPNFTIFSKEDTAAYENSFIWWTVYRRV